TAAEMKSLMQTTAIDMDVAGYDANTGYGFIQADKALQTFSNPSPLVSTFCLNDSSFTPGIDPVSVTIKGQYFASNASVIFQYDTLPATVLNSTQLSADIPSFLGNPPLTVYNPPISPSGLDGGVSDSLYFFGTVPA